jgi:hypothetical protein
VMGNGMSVSFCPTGRRARLSIGYVCSLLAAPLAPPCGFRPLRQEGKAFMMKFRCRA